MVINYHEKFDDVATFHIWGTVVMNQAFNYKKKQSTNDYSLTPDYNNFNKGLLNNDGPSTGVSAMSLSDMTNIPRATVIRKCKLLTNLGYLKLNDKQYFMTGLNAETLIPHQKRIFRNKAKFLRKILNLILIS